MLSHAQLPSSVFAERPWAGVSAKYSFLPTIEVVNALENAGFNPYSARQSYSRIEGKQGYTKHMLRFRGNQDCMRSVGGTIPEVVLVNSHDRASSFSVELGLYRLVCKNGLVVSAGVSGYERVRHVSTSIDQVLDSVFHVVAKLPAVTDTVHRMQTTILSDDARYNMAHHASLLRWDADKMPFESGRLLMHRRTEDQGKDLWSTYNVIQENLLRGQSARFWGNFRNSGQPRTSREVKSIDMEMSINRGLWDLASSHLAYVAHA